MLATTWPALYNGQPFFFVDTITYVKGADAGVYKLSGWQSVWTEADTLAATTRSAEPMAEHQTQPGQADNTAARDKPTVLAGRSIYYGALLYLGDAIGGFWFTVVVQGALFLAAIGLTLVNFGAFSLGRFAVIVLALSILTPAAFYNSYLMPDLFAGLTILAAANLVVFARQMPNSQRIFWYTLLTLAILFHSSHLLIAGAIVAAAVLWKLIRRSAVSWVAITIMLVAMLTGALGEALFGFAVRHLTDSTPIRPPFVMARLIADGPGHEFLKARCPDREFVICDYMDRLPTLNSDVFLWADDPALGVFTPESDERKQALSDEQFRFAAAVIAHDPISYIQSALTSIWSQLSLFGLSEFNYSDIQMNRFRDRLPEPHHSRLLRSPAAQQTMPTTALTTVVYVIAFVTLMWWVFSLLRRREACLASRPALFAAVVIWGILANALICGLLSTPHDRYQARVIWLLPAMILIFEASAVFARQHKLITARKA